MIVILLKSSGSLLMSRRHSFETDIARTILLVDWGLSRIALKKTSGCREDVISRVGGLANTFTGAVLGVAVDTHDEGH